MHAARKMAKSVLNVIKRVLGAAGGRIIYTGGLNLGGEAIFEILLREQGDRDIERKNWATRASPVKKGKREKFPAKAKKRKKCM